MTLASFYNTNNIYKTLITNSEFIQVIGTSKAFNKHYGDLKVSVKKNNYFSCCLLNAFEVPMTRLSFPSRSFLRLSLVVRIWITDTSQQEMIIERIASKGELPIHQRCIFYLEG